MDNGDGKGGTKTIVVDGGYVKLKYCLNCMEFLANSRCLWAAYGNLREKKLFELTFWKNSELIKFSELSVSEM